MEARKPRNRATYAQSSCDGTTRLLQEPALTERPGSRTDRLLRLQDHDRRSLRLADETSNQQRDDEFGFLNFGCLNFGFLNEERNEAGSWIYIDPWRPRR